MSPAVTGLALTATAIITAAIVGLSIGEIIATADPHQATRLDAELSLSALQEYREKFPARRDADPFTIG